VFTRLPFRVKMGTLGALVVVVVNTWVLLTGIDAICGEMVTATFW
jgi:hypothetical protein